MPVRHGSNGLVDGRRGDVKSPIARSRNSSCAVRELRFAPWTLSENVLATEWGHFGPFPAFCVRAQATHAQARLAVESADLNTGRPITHCCFLFGMPSIP